MTPTIPPGGFSLVALTAKQLLAFRNRNELKNLLRLVADDVSKTPGVAPAKVSVVKDMISQLRVDPQVMGGLKRLLDDGDLTATPLLRRRLEEILRPTDSDLAALDLAEITAKSFEANVSLAKKDDRGVSRVEAQMTRALIDERLSGLERTMETGLDRVAAGGPARIADGVSDLGFPDGTARILSDLEKGDPTSAGRLAEALKAGGIIRISELIQDEQDWMRDGGAGLWIALGRLADRGGSHGAAESAYLKAAEMPNVLDRARAVVRASGSARLRGDEVRAEELIARAESIEPENPALAIAAARREQDPETILKLLDGVPARDTEQRVLLELMRAGAESARGEFKQAEKHVSAAVRLDPGGQMVREARASVVVSRTQASLTNGAPVDRVELAGAAADLAGLAREVGAEGRPGAEATLLARASQASVLAGDPERGNELIEEALAIEDREEAGEMIAEAALLLQRFDIVGTLELGEDEPARLLKATARVLGEREVEAAAQELDVLMSSSDQAIAVQAAFMRLAAASPVHGVVWSEVAEVIVGGEKPEAAAVLKSQFFADSDEIVEAERVLAPYGSNPAPLRQLVDLAVRREDLETALRLSEELVSRWADPRDRLSEASLIAQRGDRKTARDRFLILARDPANPAEIRRGAYERAANLVTEIGKIFVPEGRVWPAIPCRTRRTCLDAAGHGMTWTLRPAAPAAR